MLMKNSVDPDQLKGLINVSSLCIRLGFHEMHACLRGPKSLLTLYQIIKKT